jgi:hypothetical protein
MRRKARLQKHPSSPDSFKDRPRRRRLEALALFLDYHTTLVEYPFYR